MKIFYVVRSLAAIPSCMYNIRMIKDCGYEITAVIGESTDSLNLVFATEKIDFIQGRHKRYNNNFLNHVSKLYEFRSVVKKALGTCTDNDIVFWGTADSAIYAADLCKRGKQILSLKELYEKPWHYRIPLKHLSHKVAAVVCCEKNRSRFIQFKWGLTKRPYAISNKPYGYPTSRMLPPTSEKTRELISGIQKEKVIVYQARHIHFAEELVNLAKALKKLNDGYQLILIGTVDNPDDRKAIDEIYSNTLWTGHIPAPLHLEITSYASVGIAVYAEISLNNLFCAPNKTFEYAGFGIPSLCNDVPGLVETIGIYRAGKCVNWSDPDEIAKGLQEIFSEYAFYSENAKHFYEENDNKKVIRKIIEESALNN